MSKKVCKRKEQIAEERRKAEEDEFLASLSEKERTVYLKNQEEQGKRAMRVLAEMIAMSAGAYSMINYKKGR